jgi:hypothetical protein
MKEFKRPQKMLGPSQVATVLGYSNFDTPDELRHKMENGYTREICPKRNAGTRDEPRCRARYQSDTGSRVLRAPFVKDGAGAGAVAGSVSRFGGCGDGLIGKDGGLEIKCQYGDREPTVYFSHRVQAVAYMYLYKRQWWDIMVCSIRGETVVERIYWADYVGVWDSKWYPAIASFCESVNWAR